MSTEDREIIDKIKKYAKQKGKKFLDDDFCELKGLSHSKFYRKLKSVESFIDFECDIDNIPEFDNCLVKLVGTGSASYTYPKFKSFRLIALA